MKICCDLCSKLLLPLLALLLSMGSLQAQSQPCDISKCSPEERAECAKRCASASTSIASLTSFLFAASDTEKAKCQPTACKKVNVTATAKLVATETVEAPNYSNNLEAKVEKVESTKKKKCCVTSCSKGKTSL